LGAETPPSINTNNDLNQIAPHTPPSDNNSVQWQIPDTPEKNEEGDNSNEITVNTVPWGPNNSNSFNLQENKPTVVFQNDDGTIGKAKLQNKEDVINEINSGASLLHKPEEEEKKKGNDDDDENTEASSNETKKIINIES